MFKQITNSVLVLLAVLGTIAFSSCANPAAGGEQGSPASQEQEKPENITMFMEVNEDYSCPFLFTWNGYEYVVENDIYSVARSEAREYKDYLYIQNEVVCDNNNYIFRIHERDNEESHTDLISLIVIDHDPGVEIGTDSAGNIHSFSRLFPPQSANDESGNDVLHLLLGNDDLSWHGEHNTTVLLDFSTVDISAGAKLVVRADGFEGSLIGDKTGQIPAVLIQTLENGEWVTRHKFFPKELWAVGVFDMHPYLRESKQIRLLSISCHYSKYHRVDSVALDNTPDNFTAATISPETARLNSQKDVLKALLYSDNDYVFTEKGDYFDAAFPCPPQDRSERDFVFISEGYYRAAGNTFYIYTKNEHGWELRYDFEPLNYHMDTMTNVDLNDYLPDVDNEYKLKVEHRVAPGVQQSAEGNLDYIYLVVDKEKYLPYSAYNMEDINILEQILEDDDVYWFATEQSAIVYFKPD